MNRERYSSVVHDIVMLLMVVIPCLATAQIQVNSTTPSAAPQGSTNLSVTVSGSGFQKGATAQWFISGTTNPGGVTVNSTTVKGSSSLTANITIATDAFTGSFDVLVKNTSGRTGVGSDSFTVTTKGTPLGCSTTGTPKGASLQTVLNPVQPNGAALITTLRLGNAIRVRPLDLNGDGVADSLVAFVDSGASSSSIPGTYIFLLDPVTGQMQTANPLTAAPWQNPMLVLSGTKATLAAVGDVNHDGIPDFAQAGYGATTYLFVGSINSTTLTPTWTPYQVLPPAGSPALGAAIAFGDVDGIGADELVVGEISNATKNATVPAVDIFKFANGAASFTRKIQDPTGLQTSRFGSAIAIGNIDGQSGNELVVGAPSGGTNGTVYVFPSVAQQSTYFTLTGPGPNFGRGLAITDVNLDGSPDLVVVTGKLDDNTAQAFLYAGAVHAGASYTNQLLPATGLGNGWATNIDVADMAAAGAIAIGAPNAVQGNCNSIQGGQGALHLYTSPFTASEQPNFVFETPSLVGSSQFEFGYGIGIAPGYPFIVIGEHFRDVGSTAQAGQVYVYKLN